MPNERLKASIITTSGLRITVYPVINHEGDIKWCGEVVMVDLYDNPTLTLIHINQVDSREAAFETTFRALQELISRLLGFTETLINRGFVEKTKEREQRIVVKLAGSTPNEKDSSFTPESE